MKKKLGRLFWPGLWVYFSVMALFIIATIAMGQYILAGAEVAVAALVLVFYVLNRERRRKADRKSVV